MISKEQRNKLAEKLLSRRSSTGSIYPLAKKTNKIKYWSRYITNAVRNTPFLEEELHCGITPSTKTGDWSDVYVVTPYGNLPWKLPEKPVEVMVGGKAKKGYYCVSKISDRDMHTLMVEIEKRVNFTLRQCLGSIDHPEFGDFINLSLKESLFGDYGVTWDIPEKKWKELTDE